MARMPVWVAAVWWVSLTSLGLWVVPMLFANLPVPAMAGAVAARLFTVQTGVSTLCGLLLLLQTRANRSPMTDSRAQSATIYVLCGMLLALLIEFAVAPRIVARENLRVWHSAGSLMYLLQWVCASVTFWKVTSPRLSHQV